MAYSELVKNFNRIRDYMRDFYVFGFKSRDEFTQRSARSYDDERRRLESWLGDYMQFRQTADGKNVFLSIDSREVRHNPLYKAFKTKSFTDGEITLHFILMDILSRAEQPLTVGEIVKEMDVYLSDFENAKAFDESTVRKKLKEYTEDSIILSEKQGKKLVYHRGTEAPDMNGDMLNFFSETAPCGVIGSFLLDKLPKQADHFTFKHHYIADALDSEILCSLFTAMREKRSITLTSINRRKERMTENRVIPLQVMKSVQSGRQYLMAYAPRFRRIASYRTDNILSVKAEEVCSSFDVLRGRLEGMKPHLWGVSTQSRGGERTEQVDFTVHVEKWEPYIIGRLMRERRCGTVEALDEQTYRFSADVYDASELIPWIRTFICRITQIHFSNPLLESQFREDLRAMYAVYGLEEDKDDAVQ